MIMVQLSYFILEHLMVRPDNLSRIPMAFFHVNASISIVIFVGLLLDWFFL